MAQASNLCFGQCDSTTAVFLADFVVLFNRVYGSCLGGRAIGPYVELVLRVSVKYCGIIFTSLTDSSCVSAYLFRSRRRKTTG